jgi:hypothetical protein
MFSCLKLWIILKKKQVRFVRKEAKNSKSLFLQFIQKTSEKQLQFKHLLNPQNLKTHSRNTKNLIK